MKPQMPEFPDDVELRDLTMLTQIAETLNRAANVQGALNSALRDLVQLMGLATGWVFILDSNDSNRWFGRGFHLAAHYNLPPGMAMDSAKAWDKGCDCQELCSGGNLQLGYNEVRCSRLGGLAANSTDGLQVHASVPLRAGEDVIGILNVAGPSWDQFSNRALALLTHVGGQMGIALERARLYDLVREQRLLEQSTLLHLSNKLLTTSDLMELMQFIVDEATRLLGVEACALLLPDENNADFLRFVAAAGWQTDPVALGRQVPADERSGSGMVMLTQLPRLVWGDKDRDISMSQQRDALPWMAEWLDDEGFASSAIVPLIVDDRTLGTMVVNNRAPRVWQRDDIRFLQLLANQAALALETGRMRYEQIEHQKLERDLEVSRDIQRSLLPESCPMVAGWAFEQWYRPARKVGGDYFDYFEVPGEHHNFGFLIADVADKGIAAALFMALSRSIIRAAATSPSLRSPAEALMRANALMVEENKTGQFVSTFYGKLDVASGSLQYTTAGHNPPLWWRATKGAVERLRGRGTVLGVLNNLTLHDAQLQIEQGDVLVLYTDGVTDASNALDERFGMARLEAVVAEYAGQGVSALLSAIIAALEKFTGEAPQADDITMVLMQRLADNSA